MLVATYAGSSSLVWDRTWAPALGAQSRSRWTVGKLSVGFRPALLSQSQSFPTIPIPSWSFQILPGGQGCSGHVGTGLSSQASPAHLRAARLQPGISVGPPTLSSEPSSDPEAEEATLLLMPLCFHGAPGAGPTLLVTAVNAVLRFCEKLQPVSGLSSLGSGESVSCDPAHTSPASSPKAAICLHRAPVGPLHISALRTSRP